MCRAHRFTSFTSLCAVEASGAHWPGSTPPDGMSTSTIGGPPARGEKRIQDCLVPALQCPILSDGPGRLPLSHTAPRARVPCACKCRAGHIWCAAHVAPRTLRNASTVKIVKSYCPTEERKKGKKEKRHQEMLVPDNTWLILLCIFPPSVCMQIMLTSDLRRLFSPGTVSYRPALQTSGSPFAVVSIINPN